MSSRSFYHSSSTTSKSVSVTTRGTTSGSRFASRRTFTSMTEEDGAGEVFTVTQDFKAEDGDSIGVHRGEKVVLIASKTKDPLKNGNDLDDDPDVDFGVQIEELLDSSAARHKMAVRPKRNYTRRVSPSRWAVQSLEDPTRKGLVPIVVLQAQEEETLERQDIIFRKEAVISELLETEEEFCRDMKDVVERYIKPMDGSKVPRFVSDKKDSLFGNFREISVFHNTVLLEGIKYYAKEGNGLGRAFLRMERDFDKHVSYCHDEPSFQQFLLDNESIRTWFEDLANRLRDDKNLTEHLKLPVQRINDYQLLLKELVKYCQKLGEDTTDLEKALELMLGIPHRADDLKYLNNIEGYHGDIHKLGRLLRHNWFKVKGKDGKLHDRYLFLFKARILVCKVRKISDNRYVFVLKEIIRLPEVEIRDHRNDPKTFEVGPFTVTSHKDYVKEPWLAEIKHYARNALTLAEHAADDLRLQVEENEKLEPLKGVELDLTFGQALSDEEMPPPPPPVVKIVEAGGTATFDCEIDCKTLIWLKDNHPFDEDLAGRVTQMSQGSLHRLEIADVRESDAGVYTAHATLADGRVTTCTANLIVQAVTDASRNKPQFTVKLKDTELLENTYLRFMVKVKGDPNPEVKFYKDDKAITYKNTHCAIETDQSEKGYYELIVPEVCISDAGVYKCVASNVHGEESCEGILKVVDDKEIFKGLGDKKSVEPEFQWIKDGAPFDPEERFKVLFQDQEDSLALVFTHVKPEDAGLYTCVASTSTGKIACSAELTVQGNVNLLFREPEAPKVSALNKLQETNIGSSAMLETKVTGYPKPDVKWIKDENEIEYSERCKLLYEDEETIALVIKNVTLEDMGEYKAVAQNVTGKSEDTITLNVKAAPTFTKKLTDVHTISGKEIKLSVQIDANPKPMVAWYKDGKQILESDHVKIIEEGNTYSLFIDSCTLYDVGSYSIVCKNNISQCSEFCKVDIEGAPIFTRNLIKRVETEEGDSLTFLVKVHGTPMPTVQWFFKGKPVDPDTRCKISCDSDTHTLTINAITSTDAGNYSCQLTNLHGTTTDHGQVYVKTAPTFIKGMGHVMAQEKDTNVGFTVEIASFPKGKVRWFCREKEISSTDSNYSFKEFEDSYTLVIKEVSSSSAGLYRCKIENEYGSNESTAELTVLCRPAFKTGLKNVTVNEGDTLTLRVEIEGTPEPEIKWFKDGNELTESAHIKISRDKKRVENYELTVNLVKEEDGGEYEVRAVNEMGTAITKSTVVVQATSTGSSQEMQASLKKESKVQDDAKRSSLVEAEEPLQAEIQTEESKTDLESNVKTQDMADLTEDNYFEVVHTKRAIYTGYRCVEVTTESVLEESCCGIVEEFSDSEDKCSKLSVTREVSIVTESDEDEVNHSNEVKVGCKQEIIITAKGDQKDDNLLNVSKIVYSSKIGDPNCFNGLDEYPETHYNMIKRTAAIPPEEDAYDQCTITIMEPSDSAQMLNDYEKTEYSFSSNIVEKKICEEVKLNEDNCVKVSLNEELVKKSAGNTTPKKQNKNELSSSGTLVDSDNQSQNDSERVDNVKHNEELIRLDKDEIEICDEREDTNLEKPSTAGVNDASPSNVMPVAISKNFVDENTSDSPTDREVTENRNEGDIQGERGVPQQGANDIENTFERDTQSEVNSKQLKPTTLSSQTQPLTNDSQYSDQVPLETSSGQVTMNSSLETNVAPQIVKNSMEDVSLYETWEHKFIVEAHGIPKPTAKWLKDDKDIPTTERIKALVKDEKYILEFTDAQLSDSAEYKVVISNELGEQTAKANLKVVGANDFRLPQILSPLKNTKTPKGHTSILSVVVSADPIPEFKWEHNGKGISPDCVTNMESKTSHHGLKECKFTLTIPSSQHADTGKYSFCAENKSGSCDCSARLDVILKPEIKIFKDALGVPYEDSQFIAVINSNPRSKIVWRKDGNKISSSDHFIMEDDVENEVYKLKIKGVLPEDAGTYTISAVNDVGEASADAKLKLHMEEPEFTKVLENITVREYAPLDLKVRAQGVPKPEVQWSKDGVDLEITEGMSLDTRCEGSVSSHLNIPHFKEEYAGKYKVRAYSLAGHVDTTCYVKLAQLSPSFSKSLGRALEVEEGEPLELRCKVEASPCATVKWFKDGEELIGSDRVQLTSSPDGFIKLRIEEASPEDCGAYKLIVENALGTDSSICAVAVNPSPRAPIFIKKLEDASISEGQPLFLQAQVMGFPLPEMKWFKDGLPLRNSRSVNFINSPGGLVGLSVEKATSENAGNYNLTVTNKLGEASSVADVEVILKDRRPEFQGYLTPTSVVEGFPVKLTVKVGGNPPPELMWTKNGSPIDIDGERIKVAEMPDGIVSLLIDGASPLDSGTYAVTATNSAGSVTSEAKLDVVDHAHENMPDEPPSFGYSMRDSWAEEGSVAHLSVSYLGNPVPEVKWFKNGKELSPDHRVTFTNDGHKVGLQIVPCIMDDMDSYKCRIINPLGEAEADAKLTVKKVYHAPVFTQKLRDLEQIIGLDGKMVCHVTGNPRPDISWFKNGKPISEGSRYKMKREGDNCVLFIKDCSPDEDGYYKCIASNRDGKDETEAQFRAVEKISSKDKGEAPCFLKKIGDQELIQGMTGRFTACISGYPEPEVEWYRNNDKLYPSERIAIEKESTGLLRLSIGHVDPDVDGGKYRVRIYNDHGEDECEASFIFDHLGDRRPLGEQFKDFEEFKHTGAPMPLADRPIISRMSDRRLTLSWKPSIPYGPREPVTYQVEMCELPKGDWFTARSGIRSCACEIRNLEPFRDYKFRVRVENKYGISDPSPYSMTYRSKLEPEPMGIIPYLAPGIDFRPESSPYFPKDFDIERPPHDGYAQAPRFLRQEHYTQYGVKGHNCNLFWFVYGYPKPKMTYFFNNELIDMGGRYDCSYTRNGQATLFINKMLERDVGMYEAVATNEHGEARQRVHLEIAEYPEFIKRPAEMTVVARHGGRLEARVVGVPQPDVKWFKDWQPLASTSRIKMNRIDPDHCNLVINEAIAKDAGLYSITASNVAGAVSCSVMILVEEKDEHTFQHYGRGHGIKTRTKPISDWYDLGDELGRGTQGITYHAVERSTGRNFAAKVMHGRGELKSFMHNELEVLNQLNSYKIIKIHDAFETLTNVTLILELAGGGELLDAITRQPYTSESEIASYMRQLLVALDYLHDQNIAHLGLTVGDLLVSHPGGDDLRLVDFGLARRIHPGQLHPLDYGMPEFVSPETIRGEGVDMSSDMWSVGVITYLLLTGVSLFRGVNDKETLMKVREGFWEFDEEYWTNLSVEARDFVTKLLVVDINGRMDVKSALRHPWLNYADRLPPNLYQIPTEKLHNYYNLWKDWYSNASCRTWYRRRPLTGAFNHPSKMVYPPHYIATPLPTPERDINEADFKKPHWSEDLSSKQPLNYDLGVITSESHYQNGPDTYLLQLRDVDFPVRIREYMKVAATRGSGVTRFSDDAHLDWRLPVIRERRRFTDVMDEEIDDERKNRINQYGFGDSYTIRRLKHEIGSRLDTHVEAEALIEASRDGQPPFMREKPQMTAIEDGKQASLSCYAVGDPKPIIQWYKNDMMIGSSNRVKIIEDDQGRSIIQFNPANSVDAGIYKVVARNRSGQTVARTRLVLAVVPDAPDSPQATEFSDTQVFLKWKQPKVDGNSAVISYSLQYLPAGTTEWKEVSSTIDHEFYLVNRLKPVTGYVFRLACRNAIGWSEPGIPSEVVRTLEEGCEKIQLSPTMKHLQSLSESGIPQERNLVQREELDYSVERAPISWLKQLPTDKYTFVSEISRGRFSVVVKGVDKTNDKVIVAKLCDYSSSGKPHVDAEIDAVKSLRHERIAALLEAFLPFDADYAVLIFEKLQGADILTYLSTRHEYTEQMVATIISQVLDGLQYLHWRNLCHLDLQPDNIVMASVRSLQVKLVDLGSSQRVTKLGNVVKFQGNMEFTAPEVLCQEPAYPQSDIWSVGVLAYVMLSGVSPFLGDSAGETRQNINFVRFRFEHLYKELTQEATRFIMLLFKRAPTKRPSAEECHEHRWLLPSEYMIKRRERAVFLGSRIKEFSDRYHQTKQEQASTIETLTNLVTGKDLKRSDSIAEELTTNLQ